VNGSIMRLELMLSPFDAYPSDLRAAAELADGLGVAGLWVMDHLAGAVHGRTTVLECLAVLGILAEVTASATIGPLVLNPAARHPTVLAQALATIDAQSGGRLQIGIGAGGGEGAYGEELRWAGLTNDPAPVRRTRVAETLAILDHLWSGDEGPWSGDLYHLAGGPGFLVPVRRPPTLVAGYGPLMARLAGHRADGFNTSATAPDLESLAATARAARDQADPDGRRRFVVTTYTVFEPSWLDPMSAGRRRLDEIGADSLVLVIPAPFDHGLIREIAAS
jgi:alkanesulfonate monooxygenase SsuD/methylene tetrahydromethanopterin reductase-like flavin-dependent oxidoreductase (luciferase family)